MSVSFRIEGMEVDRGYDVPCPDCGLSMAKAAVNPHLRRHDCSCYGYGGTDKVASPKFELVVTNANGRAILEMLHWPVAERGLEGSLDPIWIAVALACLSVDEWVEQPRRLTVNCWDSGRSRQQVDRYIKKLTQIADKALKYSRMVSFG